MEMYLINGDRQLIRFQRDGATVLTYPPLPGCQVFTFQNEKAKLLIKEFISDLFTIRYKSFWFSEKQRIESLVQGAGLHAKIMLQNSFDFTIERHGDIHLREGTVSLLAGGGAVCQATMEGGTEYRLLDLYAGEDLASQLVHFFPDVKLNTEKIESLFPFPCFVSPGLQKVVDEILDCPYDEATSPFYFDVKVREFFYLLLKESSPAIPLRYRYTSYDIGQLQYARELLLSNLSRPPLTIRQLARKAGINEFKLKEGFTHFFKIGVFECFQRARMFKARQLLLQTNKPLKEICTLAGYPRMTNFITAFRKYFGRTPGSLRRR